MLTPLVSVRSENFSHSPFHTFVLMKDNHSHLTSYPFNLILLPPIIIQYLRFNTKTTSGHWTSIPGMFSAFPVLSHSFSAAIEHVNRREFQSFLSSAVSLFECSERAIPSSHSLHSVLVNQSHEPEWAQLVFHSLPWTTSSFPSQLLIPSHTRVRIAFFPEKKGEYSLSIWFCLLKVNRSSPTRDLYSPSRGFPPHLILPVLRPLSKLLSTSYRWWPIRRRRSQRGGGGYLISFGLRQCVLLPSSHSKCLSRLSLAHFSPLCSSSFGLNDGQRSSRLSLQWTQDAADRPRHLAGTHLFQVVTRL